MRRVVVTGLGIVSPLGIGAENVWNRLLKAESGIRGVQSCDVTDLPCKIAGEVPRGDTASGKFNADDYVPPKDQTEFGRKLMTEYHVKSANELTSCSVCHR